MSNLTEQLKELKDIKPNKNWVNNQRDLLLAQIKSQSSAKPQSFLVNGWYVTKALMPTSILRFAARPVGIFTLLAILIIGSGMLGVNASKGSLPGDILYTVKRTSEKVQVGFTVGEENKAEKLVGFAEERVNEIEKIHQEDQSSEAKSEKTKIAADALKKDVEKATKALGKTKAEPQKSKEKERKSVEVIKSLDRKTEEISDKLKATEGLLVDVEVAKSLKEAKDAVNETGVIAIEVIIDKVENNEVEISEKELVEVIEKKIKEAEEGVEDARDAIEDQTETVDKLSSEDDNQKESAEGDSVTVKVEAEIKDKPQEAENALEEAKDLLNQGDLGSALEKVKESAELVKEVTATADKEIEVKVEVEGAGVETNLKIDAFKEDGAPVVDIEVQ